MFPLSCSLVLRFLPFTHFTPWSLFPVSFLILHKDTLDGLIVTFATSSWFRLLSLFLSREIASHLVPRRKGTSSLIFQNSTNPKLVLHSRSLGNFIMRSVVLFNALTISVLGINTVIAHPKIGSHFHRHKRQDVDWSNPALYAGVNWNTINYGGGGGAAATPPPSNPQPAPSPAPSPSPPDQDNHPPPQHNSPSPSPSPAPSTDDTSSGNGGGGGGGKRGLAYDSGSSSVSAFSQFSKITWAYNWGSNPAPGAANFMYVPMLWSNDPSHTGSWDSDASSATSGGGTHYLLGFNEPDMPQQANMAVGAAVSAYQQYLTPKAGDNVKLGSPAVSNGVGTNPTTGQPQGLDWLRPFLQQCSGCQISFAVVHWYGCTNSCPVEDDISAFKQQIQDAMGAAQYNGNQIPLWITEFQRLGDGADQFLNEVLPWLDGQDQVEKYAYFMDSDGILAQGDGVSPLGQQYGSS